MGYPAFGKVKTIVLPLYLFPDLNELGGDIVTYNSFKGATGIDLAELFGLVNGEFTKSDFSNVVIYIALDSKVLRNDDAYNGISLIPVIVDINDDNTIVCLRFTLPNYADDAWRIVSAYLQLEAHAENTINITLVND